MFKVMTGFFKAMRTVLPAPWLIWIGTLLFVNMVVPLFFLDQREAQAVLAATMLGALIQMSIFKAKGFVRLLGIGHLPWLPVVLWLAGWTSAIGTDTLFGQWILWPSSSSMVSRSSSMPSTSFATSMAITHPPQRSKTHDKIRGHSVLLGGSSWPFLPVLSVSFS